VALKHREGWIFDLDGTLTVAAHDFEAIRRELGLEPGKAILEQLARLQRDDAAARHARLDEIEWRIAGEARPAPGALALLQVLSSGGMRLGIVTRNSHRNALRTLQTCGLEAFFKPCCVVGREAAAPKPDPDGVHRLLAHWSLAPDRAVVVGDYRFDLLAGRAAGTATAHVDPTGEFAWPEHADVQVRGLDALRATLAAR
jgi:HAD superfamily hydrolase (TIGR01509 family)